MPAIRPKMARAIATTVRYTLPSRQQLKEQLQRLQG
jgi:hypothetical protein